MGTRVILILALIVPAASAQHHGAVGGAVGGGFGRAAGPPTMGARPIHSTGFRVVGRRNGGFVRGLGYGLGFGWPYSPTWDYGLDSQLYYGDDFAGYPQYAPAGNALIVPVALEAVAPPSPKPASSVIHEYSFGKETVNRSGERASFAIVLKDGSTRSAAASWVAGGKLHYLDLQSRQQELSPELIDRDATDRANEAKNLRMELPPG